MARNPFLALPPDLNPAAPDFIPTLNDRLRRISDSAQPPAAAAATPTVAAASTLTGSPNRPVIGTATAPKLLAPGDAVDLTGGILRAPNGSIGLSGTFPVRAGTVFTISSGVITGYSF
jgi:hypothetical protein